MFLQFRCAWRHLPTALCCLWSVLMAPDRSRVLDCCLLPPRPAQSSGCLSHLYLLQHGGAARAELRPSLQGKPRDGVVRRGSALKTLSMNSHPNPGGAVFSLSDLFLPFISCFLAALLLCSSLWLWTVIIQRIRVYSH